MLGAAQCLSLRFLSTDSALAETDGGESGRGFKLKLKRLLQQSSVTRLTTWRSGRWARL